MQTDPNNKAHRKLFKSISLAKQKLIFYLSFVKSDTSGLFGSDDRIGCKEFVKLFVNDKIYQRINADERTRMVDALKGSKYFKVEEQEDNSAKK